MLSISAMGKGQGNYYLHLAREDYYLNGGEPPGYWLGTGAKKLGLSGQVTREQLRSLLDGFAPAGEPLIQNAGGKDHQPGWDLTFSAAKSVSAIWSQFGPEVRRQMEQAHAEAVSKALDYILDTCAFSRRGKGGRVHQRADLIIAAFQHGTSRASDPQLHTHCLIMNVGVRPDGTTGTILSLPIYQHKMAAGVLYRVELSAQLQQRLEIACERVNDTFEITGVPKALMDKFSTRRAAIEKELASSGMESASAAAFATLKTRQVKELVPPRAELFAQWKEAGRGQLIQLQPAVGRNAELVLDNAWRTALDKLTFAQSHFTAQEVLRAVAVECQATGIGADRVRDEVKRRLGSAPEIVKLARTLDRYTTTAVLGMERELRHTADKLRAREHPGVPQEGIEKTIERYSAPRSALLEELKHHGRQIVRAARQLPTEKVDRAAVKAKAPAVLTREQTAAIRALTGSHGGSIRLLEGRAGSGKGFLLGVARETWESAGYRVVGTAVAGKACRELETAAGIPSMPLRMLELVAHPTLSCQLKHHARQLGRAALGKPTYALERLQIDRNTVLVVDEASMIGTRQMLNLAEMVRRDGGLLVLVGDRRQLQPIEAGAPFPSLGDRIGRTTISKVIRQKDPRDIQAIEDIANGKPRAALANLAGREAFCVEPNREAAIRRLVQDWSKLTKTQRDHALIFVGMRQEAAGLNSLCQSVRLRLGEVSHGVPLSLPDGPAYVGDRVVCKKRSRALGLENGEFGTIRRIGPRGRSVTLKLDSGKTINIRVSKYNHLQLGYAVTTHSGQGTTIDYGFALVGGRMQSRELAYVQASRARKSVRLYTDQNEAGHDLKTLLKQLTQSSAKTLAQDIIDRQHGHQFDIER